MYLLLAIGFFLGSARLKITAELLPMWRGLSGGRRWWTRPFSTRSSLDSQKQRCASDELMLGRQRIDLLRIETKEFPRRAALKLQLRGTRTVP